MAEAEQILKAIHELSVQLKEIECNIVEFSNEVKDEFNQINEKLDRQMITYINVR
ncbi:hypothetical protein K3L72_10195 [Bacillus altitudinis]|uniref:Uncharacterized protein n=1 Tax=Bacillus altitudinis TaxID=293387 RepID=A0ABV1S3P5_BACAB|nr:hypothetical protein [Bacillus altitudinis]MBY0186477.1 hypothetical protein [Bacillus aerophilus]MCW4358151.1 hypothetical protein [Bacillus altitudinis]MCY7579349.1 hypothetical protein [Bacillus altitudinis]MCY7594660.1 hypothetical protein [Bacillus altitudinis]WJE31536.1 hypothetical protein QRD87_06565 [Bacillus altitudinis]